MNDKTYVHQYSGPLPLYKKADNPTEKCKETWNLND